MPQETTTRYGGMDMAVFLTLTAMRAQPVAQSPSSVDGPQLCVLTGGAVAFDGNPVAIFAWNKASVAADDSYATIKITAVTTGRWIRVTYLNP